MLLPVCGTDLGYAATSHGPGEDVIKISRSEEGRYEDTDPERMVLCKVRYCLRVWRAAMSGMDLASAAMQSAVVASRMVLRNMRYCASAWCYAMCGTSPAYGATRCAVLAQRMVLRDVRYCPSVWCYATCGSALAYGATRCADIWCCALCGTDLAYGATRCAVLPERMWYGPIAYGAMPCPVLTYRVWCYQALGEDPSSGLCERRAARLPVQNSATCYAQFRYLLRPTPLSATLKSAICYAHATPCPVLTQRMLLPACARQPRYLLRACYEMAGTDVGGICYARATRWPVLTRAMLLPGRYGGVCTDEQVPAERHGDRQY
eukprot:1097842-Rhodomonas_salina.1